MEAFQHASRPVMLHDPRRGKDVVKLRQHPIPRLALAVQPVDEQRSLVEMERMLEIISSS
jgi:hypothetical protein